MTDTDDSGINERNIDALRAEAVDGEPVRRSGEAESEPSFAESVKDIVQNRAVILFSIVVDSVLLVGASGVFLLVHHLIGDISVLSEIDQIVLISVQALAAVGTIGTLAAWLIRDLRHAIVRAWKE